MTKPFVHSWSSLESYQLCPLKFYKEKISKEIKFEETEAIMWGNACHRELELAIKERRSLGKRFEMYQSIVDKVLSLRGTPHTELKLGVDRELNACGFFDSDCYVRGVGDLVLDYGHKIAALDWKTGKKKAGSKQLALMALLCFAKFPEAQEISTAFVWLQGGSITSEIYTRDQIADLWEPFLQGFAEIEFSIERNVWARRENFLCKSYCQVFDCMFNGRGGK
jgi:hypothetical protein